jgi:xanthine/CO dehydrogenase XdhC/CoxF family maturation factor
MSEICTIFNHLADLKPSDSAILCTLVSVKGSSYRRPGARLLIVNNCRIAGNVSGGCLEEDLMFHANQVSITGIAQVVKYDTTNENDLVWGVGLGCNGIVHVLVEKLDLNRLPVNDLYQNLQDEKSIELVCIHDEQLNDKSLLGTYIRNNCNTSLLKNAFIQTLAPPHHLVIFGAGNDAIVLHTLAHELGWTITIADPRPAYATKDRFPKARAIIGSSSHSLVAQANIKPEYSCVVMTHHYIHDLPVLKDLLSSPCGYIGLLGPKKRAEKILNDIASEGLAITQLMKERLHAPVGLNLGGDTPQSVALSIIAEIQAYLSRRDARPLRERNEPIHS